MQRKLIVGIGVTLALAAGVVTGLTFWLRGTTFTTELFQSNSVTVDGHPALSPKVVAGITQVKYHPLPWLGVELADVQCPGGLPATAGARMTCKATTPSGSKLDIPVRVLEATASTITWSFQR